MDVLEELDITTEICQTIMIIEDYMQWFIDQGCVERSYDDLGYVMHFSKRWNHTNTYQKQDGGRYYNKNLVAYKAGKLMYMAEFDRNWFPLRRIRKDDIIFTFSYQLESYETSTRFYSYKTGLLILKRVDLYSPDKNIVFNKIDRVFIDKDQISAHGDFMINGVKMTYLQNKVFYRYDNIRDRSDLLEPNNIKVKKPITVDVVYKLPNMNIKKQKDIPLFSLYDMIYTDFDITSYNVSILEDNFISYL